MQFPVFSLWKPVSELVLFVCWKTQFWKPISLVFFHSLRNHPKIGSSLSFFLFIAVGLFPSRGKKSLPTPRSSFCHLLSRFEARFRAWSSWVFTPWPLIIDWVCGLIGFSPVCHIPISPFSSVIVIVYLLRSVTHGAFVVASNRVDDLSYLVGFARLPYPDFPFLSVISVVFLLRSFPSPDFWFLLWFWSHLLCRGNHRDITVILELNWVFFLFFGFGFVIFVVGLTDYIRFLCFPVPISGLFFCDFGAVCSDGGTTAIWWWVGAHLGSVFFAVAFGFVCLGWWVNRLLPLFAFS